MKKSLIILLSMTLSLFACGPKFSGKSSAPKRSDIFANQIIVKGDQTAIHEYLKQSGLSAEVQDLIPEQPVYKVVFKNDVDLEKIQTDLEGKSGIVYAEPNYRVHLNYNMNLHEWPKDRMFFKQWALNNIGQSPPFGIPGERGSDLDMMKAWSISKGAKSVVVAVIDTGVDYTHPDLKNNMWLNEKEAPANGGKPGIDDDGNGYVDDVYGFDFVSEGRSSLWYGKLGDPEPMDTGGHGTHCAGSIGASSNNDQGITGINWEVSIMALRFLGDAGGSSADAARAVYYAVDKNVDVMSNSWGGGGESKLLKEAIAAAQNKGILFVAAAGNENTNNDVTPAYPASYEADNSGRAYDNILAVGASDNQDNPAEFSNYGHEMVHVFAPGVEIISTYPVAMTQAGRPPYAVMSGTSMATPYVAGVAALMIAANPSLRGKAALIKDILIKTSDQRNSLIGKSRSNGRVNAYRALSAQPGSAQLKENWKEMSVNVSQRGYTQELIDIRHTVTAPKGAKAMKVHFNFIQINEPFDSVYIYDKDFRLITRVEDTETRSYWSPVVPGDKIHIRLVNSIVKKVEMMMKMEESSEYACLSAGAIEAVDAGNGKFSCQMDSSESGDGGSKTYNSFGSEGFAIDRMSFLPDDNTRAR